MRLTQIPDTGTYLTDGRRLFCVAGVVSSGRSSPAIELEDCLTLEMRLVTKRELASMRLRVVSRESFTTEDTPQPALD